MKKRFFSALVLIIFLAGCGASHVSVKEIVPVPKDKPLYGYTEDGVFFLHHSLYENVSGKTPIVAVESSGNVGRHMDLEGEYYVYDVHNASRDLYGFEQYRKRRVRIQYIFPIDEGRWLPVALGDKTGWVDEDDIFDVKGRVKNVFSTNPVENPFLQEK